MAKIDEGSEQLYAYTTSGNKASFIYDKTTPVEERVVNVTFLIGNAQNIEVKINNSIVYVTLKDLEAVEKKFDDRLRIFDKETDITAKSSFTIELS